MSPDIVSRRPYSPELRELLRPFFDPAELEAIKKRGDEKIALSTFSANHGLAIIKGHEDIVASLLAQDDQETRFSEEADGLVTFRASDIEHVANAFQRSHIEELTPHIVGGRERLNEIGQILAETVGSGS